MQMGMMKEHVLGPIKCCETLCTDILLKTRADELSFHEEFKHAKVHRCFRVKLDNLGGTSRARFLGKPVKHTVPKVLKDMLRVVLDRGCGSLEGLPWETKDYHREDLVLHGYTKARINSYTYNIKVDWNSSHKSTADYFMYYTQQRHMSNYDTKDVPMQPSLA